MKTAASPTWETGGVAVALGALEAGAAAHHGLPRTQHAQAIEAHPLGVGRGQRRVSGVGLAQEIVEPIQIDRFGRQ